MIKQAIFCVVLIAQSVIADSSDSIYNPKEIEANNDENKKMIAIIVSSLFVAFLAFCAIALIAVVVIRKVIDLKQKKSGNDEEPIKTASVPSSPSKPNVELNSPENKEEVAVDMTQKDNTSESSESSESSKTSSSPSSLAEEKRNEGEKE